MPEERLRAGMRLVSERYQVRWDPDGVLAREGFLAGDDDRRAAELDRCLRDPDVRAIFVARGGYGIMRILERLDAAALRADPKWIVGFSDATALLSWALARAGVCGLHGPVVTQLGELPAGDAEALFATLEDPTATPALSSLQPVGAPGGPIEGHLVGGNLALVAHLAATPYLPPLAGSVLLLEDVGERPYAVDRYLTGLHLAGALDGVRGVLLGDFTGCEETKGPPDPDVWAVLDERLTRFGIPGRRGAPVGHGARNLSLVIGQSIRLG